MQHIDNGTLERLQKEQQWPAISIYMPISRTGDQQDSIRFKNLLGQVEEQLVEGGIRSSEARNMLESWFALLKDTEFWKHAGADGLALFRNGDFEQHHLLPIDFKETVQVGKHFHIKPLLPLFRERSCLLLGLNRSEIHLYRVDRFNVRELELPEEVPDSLQDTLKYDDPESQLQFHSKTRTQGEKRGAMYHGQGVGTDDDTSNLERYFQAVDRALAPMFEKERLPVVLGGTDELQGNYRRISKCKNLLPEGVAKNISDLSNTEIHTRAWEVAARYIRTHEQEALEQYAEKQGTGLTVDTLADVLTAAFEGRVDCLFAATDEQVWGIFKTDSLETMVVDRNEAPTVDLIDEAVFWTLARGGRVFGRKREDMPSDSEVCALLRF